MHKSFRIAAAHLLALALLLAGGAAAFADTIRLPSSLTVIGEGAFMGDTSLDEVILPEGLTEIQAGAFAGSSLRAVHIPSTVTRLAGDAFAGTDPVYYTASLAAFNGNLNDRGTVHLTQDAVITEPTSFRNTRLIVDEGVTLAINSELTGSELSICGEVYNYGKLVVENAVSTFGEGFLSAPYAGSYTEIPAENYLSGLRFRMNRDAGLRLRGLDEIVAAAELVWGDAEAEIAHGGDHALFRFAPEESGSYILHSACAEDVYCRLFRADGELLAYDDDGSEERNFRLDYPSFAAGETYYFDVVYYDPAQAGTIPLSLRFRRVLSGPENAIASPGETARFAIEAVGDDLGYQWQTAEPGSDAWSDCIAEGSGTDTLCLTAQPPLDGLRVRCAVSDARGRVAYSETAVLYVAARELEPGDAAAEITRPGARTAFRFVPRVAGSYTLSSSGQKDACVFLYDADGRLLGEDDDSGPGDNFQLRYDFEADTVYYFLLGYYNESDTGSLAIRLNADLMDVAIRFDPMDMVAAPGRTACFRVEADGSALRYRWQVLLPGEETWQPASGNGSDTDTLRFEARADYDGRQYRCAVTDGSGFTAYSGAAALSISERSAVNRALVIGNQMYTMGELSGCHNDVNAMAGMLRGLANSFFVHECRDLTAAQMRSSIRSAFANATEEDVSLFYYSGHGMDDASIPEKLGSLIGVSYDSYHADNDYLTPGELAALLSEVPGRVIVVLDSCCSGAMIASKSAQANPERMNRNVLSAFAAYERRAANAKTEELRKSKFVVFTASKPYEDSWTMLIDGVYGGAFTCAFVNSCGSEYRDGSYLGYIPADVNGDLCLSAAEIYKASYRAALIIQPLQHAVYYAADPDEILFSRN